MFTTEKANNKIMRTVDTKVLNTLISDLKGAVAETGSRRVVAGLSGGIDSAVSAALAVRALGRENVFGFFLPYKDTVPQSAVDAGLVAEVLGISLETVGITAMANQYTDISLPISPVRLGNILSRLRMIVLFDKSAVQNALVLGTGNKSEMLLGYMTWFGDSACSINPLGDMYKTQVWEAARLLGIPEQIITKAPSADHYKGQTDEHDLGYRYEEIDRLLFELIEKKSTEEELIKSGFEEVFVRDIITRVESSEYKRKLPRITGIGQKRI